MHFRVRCSWSRRIPDFDSSPDTPLDTSWCLQYMWSIARAVSKAMCPKENLDLLFHVKSPLPQSSPLTINGHLNSLSNSCPETMETSLIPLFLSNATSNPSASLLISMTSLESPYHHLHWCHGLCCTSVLWLMTPGFCRLPGVTFTPLFDTKSDLFFF